MPENGRSCGIKKAPAVSHYRRKAGASAGLARLGYRVRGCCSGKTGRGLLFFVFGDDKDYSFFCFVAVLQ